MGKEANRKKIRILFLEPSPVPLPIDPKKNKFYYLSKCFTGDVLAPFWSGKTSEALSTAAKINNSMGEFSYHVNFSWNLPVAVRGISDLLFYLVKGIQLAYFHSHQRYDVIISYGTHKTGLAASLLRFITGAKLVVEIQGNYLKAITYSSRSKNSGKKEIKSIQTKMLMRLLGRSVDAFKLLYPSQLEDFPYLNGVPKWSFHDFVATGQINVSACDEKYIFFLGHPWYLKGVDILIEGFKLLREEFPLIKLKIMGYCPDSTYFQQLRNNDPRIEFISAANHEVAMHHMGKCTIFVLPSRTEAMGRVLLEAMASGKPVIASAVDGIPYYIRHDFNGLLFQSEDSLSLAEQMRRILLDPALSDRLTSNALKKVKGELSEEAFVTKYQNFISSVLM